MITITTNDTSITNSDTLALQYLIREPEIKTAKRKALILMHGVGSNEKDLFSLASRLPKDVYIIAPRGQFTLSPGRYAWFEVDFSSGKPSINAAQELSSRKVVETFIGQVKQKYNLDEVYVGGFSQGAIMGFTMGLLHPDEVQGVIALSGRLLQEIRPLVISDSQLQKLPVFLAHGIQDNTLPIHFAREAKTYLESLHVQLTYHEYNNMGHQINDAVLNDLNTWLEKR